MEFKEIVGNENIKLQLQIASKAALISNTSIPHILFTGAPGCGKTTMSKALATDQGTDFIKLPPEEIKTSQNVFDLVEKLNIKGYTSDGRIVAPISPTIVFLDEIHQLSVHGQEILGIAMENFSVAVKCKYTSEVRDYWIPRFTLVGATTEEGKLTKPFRDRFKLIFHTETYSLEEAQKIALIHAEKLKVKITEKGALEIAKRGRGTPRIVVGYLERVRDALLVLNKEVITEDEAKAVFEIIGVDETGLIKNDVKLLKTLYEAGTPVGIEMLSIVLNESQKTILHSREPYLIQKGLLIRTGKGRILTKKGVEYLKEHGYVENKKVFAIG